MNMSELTEKLKSKSCGEISCDQCDEERLEAGNKIEYLLIQNLRIQLDLDASCNAEELRQVRAENARLIHQIDNLRKCGTAVRNALSYSDRSWPNDQTKIREWDTLVGLRSDLPNQR